MASRRPSVRPKSVAVILVAALALVTAACGGGSDKKKAASTGSTTSVLDTSTTVAGDTTTVAPAAGGTATTKAGAARTATTKAATVGGQPQSNYTPPPGSTPATPSQPGTYRYDNSGSSSPGGAAPPVSTLVVDPPAGTRQHSKQESRAQNGDGSTSETTLDYQPQGVFLARLTLTTKAGPFNDVTDFAPNPPVLIAPTGAKPGTPPIEFDLSGSGQNVHVKVEFVRNERLTIGGQAVDTLVVHQTGTLSGKINGTQTSDSWVQLHGPSAKNHTVLDGTYSGVKVHSDITSTLQKLTPG